jgi:hypothetical protein
MFDVQGSVCALAAIDHAHSLDHGNPTDPLAVGISAGYGTAGRPDCDATLRNIANAISSLDWNTVEKMVRRLGPILTDQDKSRILQHREHTIFCDAIFPDACARTWWEIGGGKKTPPISRRRSKNAIGMVGVAILAGPQAPWGYQGNRGGPPGGVGRASALPSNLPAPTLACAVSGGQALGSRASKGQQSIDDRGLAPLRSSMASPYLYLTPPRFLGPPSTGGYQEIEGVPPGG